MNIPKGYTVYPHKLQQPFGHVCDFTSVTVYVCDYGKVMEAPPRGPWDWYWIAGAILVTSNGRWVTAFKKQTEAGAMCSVASTVQLAVHRAIQRAADDHLIPTTRPQRVPRSTQLAYRPPQTRADVGRVLMQHEDRLY